MRTVKDRAWIAGLAAAAGLSGPLGWGATYNFYFNNTEQGANSQANPQLTVTGDGLAGGGKALPAGTVSTAALSQTPGEPVPAPAPEAVSPVEEKP